LGISNRSLNRKIQPSPCNRSIVLANDRIFNSCAAVNDGDIFHTDAWEEDVGASIDKYPLALITIKAK